MQFDTFLLTALVILALPLLGLNLVAWWWQRRQQDPHFPLQDPFAASGQVVPNASLAVLRLRVTPVLRVALTVLTLALALALALALVLPGLLGQVSALAWPGMLLLAILIWNTLAVWLWELRFDTLGLSAPSKILWRRSYLWRQLVRVTDDNPFAWHFHFADGALLRVPKQTGGREQLMQMARHWLELGQRDGAGIRP